MPECNATPHERRPLCPFPYALYDSLGLLFELFQGGQPAKPRNSTALEAQGRFVVLRGSAAASLHVVHWHHLSPIDTDHHTSVRSFPQVQS